VVKLVILPLNFLLKEITPMKRKEKARISLASFKKYFKRNSFYSKEDSNNSEEEEYEPDTFQDSARDFEAKEPLCICCVL
jgi:hypothetical protein